MDVILGPLLSIMMVVTKWFMYAIVISAILSWLVAFNVVNTGNRFVYMVGDFLHRLTEPALRPIRKFVPNLGGIDISPVVLILLLAFVQLVLERLYVSFAY